MELPPRTRRILPECEYGFTQPGTTSAHAENTIDAGRGRPNRGNYLRARGEYLATAYIVSPEQELPPRTRRIRGYPPAPCTGPGTTSAHAENTKSTIPTGRNRRNYLRARGEYLSRRANKKLVSELPPRTRRIRLVALCGSWVRGTTSAHAENTVPWGGDES